MRFLVDENLGPALARGMAGFGEDVMHFREKFEPGTPDAEWLPIAGSNEWLIITRDDRMRHRPLELRSIRDHRVGGFVLAGKGRSRCELIEQLVKNWRRMKAEAERARRPFLMRVPASGAKVQTIPLD